MKYLFPVLLIAVFFACGNTPDDTPAPPAELGLETVPEDQPTEDLRETEDLNPDGDERALDDLIRVTAPVENAVISSPFVVRGDARGTWFFEGSFPVALYDADGKLLDESFGHSPESWMTPEFIPFESTVEWTAPTGTEAWLELALDNPAGDEGTDRAVRIPVVLR